MTRRHLAGHDVDPLLVAAAFLVLSGAVVLAVGTSAAWWAIPAGIIAPDLTFLAAGTQKPTGPGRMPPRAVRPYNTAHNPVLPIACLCAAVVFDLPTGTAFAATWLSHIIWDRSVGYTMRDKTGALTKSAWAVPVNGPTDR